MQGYMVQVEDVILVRVLSKRSQLLQIGRNKSVKEHNVNNAFFFFQQLFLTENIVIRRSQRSLKRRSNSIFF